MRTHGTDSHRILATSALLALLFVSPIGAQGQQSAAGAAPAQGAAAALAAPEPLPPLPADAHVDQTMQVGGRTLKYVAKVGIIPVFGADNKRTAEVVYTSYTVEGADRPVTFAFNGGPGASSVYLNLGAIGPKRLQFGGEGDSPSDAPVVSDNPGTWLDFTDLVFIDPVGTGYSRSLEAADATKKDFYSTENDIKYLSKVVFDWLVKNERLRSRKYIAGESYGGYRVPRITHYLQSQLGVAMNGIVAVSPYLNPSIDENADLSPMAWVVTLPSIAAARLEREKKLSADSMASVIAYARGEYVTDLLKGRSDPQAVARLTEKVAALTGLDPAFVRRSGGRLETGAYLREVYREQGKLASVYDSNVTSFDPYPLAPQQRSNDPLLESIVAPVTTAIVDFTTRVVGWKVSAAYKALSYEVNAQWDFDSRAMREGAVPDLRQAVAADPKLRVLIVHGWNDLSCPFMGSVLTVDQMPLMGDAARVAVKMYPGGHMFYSRPESRDALRADVQAMFAKH